MLKEQYRRDYTGEFIVLKTRFADGKKYQEREWVENPIENQHISGRAAVILSDINKDQFDYTKLQRHRGWLLSQKKLQTYGSGELWQNMNFNFFVSLEKNQLEKIKESQYDEDTVVYTSSSNCIASPGHFYLIPFSPRLDQMALAIYLAAFDGHEEIFLLGLSDEIDNATTMSWVNDIENVFKTYSGTRFYLVGVESRMHKSWRKCVNVKCMDYRTFISYCDI